MKYSVLLNQNWFNCIDNIQYFDINQYINIFSIISITFFYLFTNFSKQSIYEFFTNLFIYRNFLRIFYDIEIFTRIRLFINQTKWRFVFFLRISHFSFFIRRSFFLIFFFLHLYFCEWHFHESINNAKFSIFVRTTSTESNQSKICLIRLNKKNAKKLFNAKTRIENQKQIQTKNKKIDKTKKKIRITTKRIEKYTCKRCKHSIKFDNNIKLHEHIRIRHAKKSKFV